MSITEFDFITPFKSVNLARLTVESALKAYEKSKTYYAALAIQKAQREYKEAVDSFRKNFKLVTGDDDGQRCEIEPPCGGHT